MGATDLEVRVEGGALAGLDFGGRWDPPGAGRPFHRRVRRRGAGRERARAAALCVIDGVVLAGRRRATGGLRRASVREAGTDWLNAGPWAELVEGFARPSFVRRRPRWVRRPAIEEIAAVSDVRPTADVLPSRDLYDRVDCPMTVALATNGFHAARREEGEGLVGSRPGRRPAVIDSNHNVAMTRPAELARVVLDTVRETARGSREQHGSTGD